MTEAPPYAECAESKLLCSWCGGKCCKRGPGKAWPSDFNPDVEAGVRAALATGRWEIVESWAIPGDAFYPRPRMTRDMDGWCTFWHMVSGCELPYAKRPRECRLLEAAGYEDNGDCKGHTGGTGACCRAWRPYREFLRELYKSQ